MLPGLVNKMKSSTAPNAVYALPGGTFSFLERKITAQQQRKCKLI